MIDVLSAFSPVTLVCAPLIVMIAYAVLGITGFGASITAMPLLAHLLPVRFAVPIMVVLDFSASLIIGTRNRSAIARSELKLIVFFMILGIVLGSTILAHAPEKWLMFALGIFVLCFAVYGMVAKAEVGPIGRAWAVPLGTIGGIFGGLFGTGGPLYAIYLARRLRDKSQLRATMAAVIFVSAVSRFGIFAIAGLFSQRHMLSAIAGLFPFMLAGLWLGNRLHHRLAAERVMQGMWLVLIIGGASLLARSLLA